MNTNVEQNSNSLANIAKLVFGVVLLIAAIGGYYYFKEVSWPLRASGLIVAFGLSAFIIAFTSQGRQIKHFLIESNFELRKMVWPTRQETVQTTLVILVVVIIVSIVIWLIDMFLGWVVLENLLKSKA